MRKQDKLLQEAARTGEVPSHGAVGTQFNRDMKNNKERKAEYDKCKTHEQKRAFRKDWVVKKWDSVKAKYEIKETEKSEEGQNGIYLPFSVIWKKEGKDAEGYQAPKPNRIDHDNEWLVCI